MAESPTDPRDEGRYEPIARHEVMVSAAVWDLWAVEARRASLRSGRPGWLVGVLVALAVTALGLLSESRGVRLSFGAYGVLLGWGIGAWLRTIVRRRRLRSLASVMRSQFSGTAVARLDDGDLIAMLSHTLVTAVSRSMVIRSEPDGSTVRVTVLEYDPSQLPSFEIPSSGGG